MAALAAQKQEPSAHELLQGTGKSDVQHAMDWQHVVHYLDRLKLSHLRTYQPLNMPKEKRVTGVDQPVVR